MKRLLGLDTSSKAIHGVILNKKEELVELHKWSSNKKNSVERFPDIVKEFSVGMSKINIVDYAAIEAAIFVQNRKALISLASVIGATWAILVLNGIDTALIHHAEWKKEILGKGSLKKEDIMSFAKDKWGDKFPEQDYADAACIALWNKRRF